MNNRNRLYDLLKRLKAMGRSVIVITHDVEELIQITDSITVPATAPSSARCLAKTSPDEIKRMMVGRD